MYVSRKKLYDRYMVSLPVSAARDQLPAVIESARSEAVTLLRHGKPVAVILSPERFDELMDAWEELQDVAAFDAAMLDGDPTIPWEKVRMDLGWT